MKCICIAGATQADLELVFDVLQQAGMKPPKPAKRGEPIDIASWHEQVLAMEAEETEDGYAIANPGRFMEQLASDIFVANLKSNPWGWANTRSVWMLDFWLNFDPNIYFILVSVSPQHMLARVMMTETEDVSIETVMGFWQAHQQQLLRFHHRNPQRSLLVGARECAEYPRTLIEYCTKQWKLKVTTSGIPDFNQMAHDSLGVYLAQQLCLDYPQTNSLQRELDATLTRLGGAEQTDGIAQLSPEQIITDYRALRDRSAELEQLRAAYEELATLKVQLDDAIANHVHKQKAAETAHKKANQENKLLLAQRQQVEEKLEVTFLNHESARKQVNELQTQAAELGSGRAEQAKLASDRYAQILALTQERAAITNEKAELIKARDEQSRLAGMQIEALTSERDAALLKCETAQNAAGQQVAQAGLLESKLGELKESQQENELLLLQLHQVQEELEHYFLQQQDAQKQVQDAEARWQRMLQRNPAYCDYETIELLPDTTVEEDSSQTIWRLTNLHVAGRFLPKLEFKTILEQGVAGFIFEHASEADSSLLRWPLAEKDAHNLLLIPAGNRDNIEQRIRTLLDLATSDWDLLQILSRLLNNILNQWHSASATFNVPEKFQPEALHAGLEKLDQLIARVPNTLRYNQVALKREQVNPDYEHLWLRLDNLDFDGRRWPQFEFRISCANVRPNHFGTYPKLEFPESISQSPFTGWFVEAHDDHGPKLELRFQIPNAMDTGVWQRMTAHDRAFVSALISRLPVILAGLQTGGTKLKRSWDDWIKMAHDIQRVHHLFTVIVPQTKATQNTNIATASPDKKPDASAAPVANTSGSRGARKASSPKSVRKIAPAKTAKASR